jgi:hypothetical protein
MIADLHAHYPMRVITDLDPETAAKAMKAGGGATIRDRIQALVLRIANKIDNHPTWDGTYRITPESLRDGDVRLAMSVLFRPFEEMDLSKPYAAPPEAGYFPKLIADLEAVEREVATHDRSMIRLVHNRLELDEGIAAGATALVHSVEGGFHLGDSPAEIEANCAKLAARGVGVRNRRTSLLPPDRDERERGPVHPGPSLRFPVPAARQRPAHDPRRSGRPRPGSQSHHDRSQPHGSARDRRDVRPARQDRPT